MYIQCHCFRSHCADPLGRCLSLQTTYAYPDAQHTVITRPGGVAVTVATNVAGDTTSITVPGGASGRLHAFTHSPATRTDTETAPLVSG